MTFRHWVPLDRLALLVALAWLVAFPAIAQPSPSSPAAQPQGPSEQLQPSAPETRQSAPGGETGVKPGEAAPAGLWERANLLGDLGGVRTSLADRGITFGLTETSEVFGNYSGGVRQGAIYEGLTQFGLGIDTEKLFGWQGGTFNVTGYQIHGRGLSANNLDNNLNSVSGIEALRGTLLFELWYEQVMFDKKVAIRVGQLSADQEFMLSQYAGLFLNCTFGWPTFPSVDLPSGGPSFPLATPGVRMKFAPRDDLAVLLGVFNGDPAGPGPGIAQQRDSSGTDFRLHDGVFVIAELQYAINSGDDAAGLPGTYKLGAWYNSENFADQRTDALGLSLAAPAAAGSLGRSRRGNWSIYAIADQLVSRREGTKDQGLGAFARIMGAPGDRNLLNFYFDAGVTYKGLIPGRASDTLGLAFAFARISDTAAKLDFDTAAYAGQDLPIRRHEAVLELTYQAQIAPWWQVQPSAQYIFSPNGGVPNPLRPGKLLGDAGVLGIRTTITF